MFCFCYVGDMIMSMVVGLMVREIKDRIYADPGRFDLKLNDKVIVETEHGFELGVVCEKEKNIQASKDSIGKIFRKVTQEDQKKL
jgi:cell fate regulator YaaT (PSP1 superfamily)